MIEPESIESLREQLRESIRGDSSVLEELRQDVRPLKGQTKRINARSSTAISLVGTDGGNNRIEFDPFMVQLVRVVDSANNEYCLESLTPSMDRRKVNARHFNSQGEPKTALGRMMVKLGVGSLWELSPMIPPPRQSGKKSEPLPPSWVQVYRELTEWAILLELASNRSFGTDTVIVFDGNLRSKVFASELFIIYRNALLQAIEHQRTANSRRVYVVGVGKHSKVLQRYRLAMALEGVLRTKYPAYVEVPRGLESQAYVWDEYARGDEEATHGGESNKFVGGKMFFVKFGSRPHDPVWPVDIFNPQAGEASTILGHMLSDAIDGFPVPFYPLCLQRAHENAALVDFDFVIMQDQVIDAVRDLLGEQADRVDELSLQSKDPSAQRY